MSYASTTTERPQPHPDDWAFNVCAHCHVNTTAGKFCTACRRELYAD